MATVRYAWAKTYGYTAGSSLDGVRVVLAKEEVAGNFAGKFVVEKGFVKDESVGSFFEQ